MLVLWIEKDAFSKLPAYALGHEEAVLVVHHKSSILITMLGYSHLLKVWWMGAHSFEHQGIMLRGRDLCR